MKHIFDVEIAEKYGVNAAIMLENIAFWIRKNEANNVNFHDGFYWTYNSRRAFKELFPYLSEKQIETALKKLIDDGVIITGNYNETAYDRTMWYAITKKGECILHFREMDTEEKGNGLPENVKPIPDINTDSKQTDNKPDIKQERKTARRQPKASFDELIKQYSKGDPEVEHLLGEWLKVRKAKRAAMTDYAIELNLKKLDNLAAESCMSVTEYLKEVICRGWNAFYAINNYNNGGSNYGRNQQSGSKGSNGAVNGTDPIKWNDSLFV